MSKKKTSARIRTELLAALRREVAELVRQDHIDALLETLTGTGYDTCHSNVTSFDIGRAIVTIAPLVDDLDDLAGVVHTAAFYRHMGNREKSTDTPTEKAHRELAEHLAEATLYKVHRHVLGRWLLRMNNGLPPSSKTATATATSAEVH